MNHDKYIEKINSVLKELEERGDIVITTVTPQNIAKEIYHSALEGITKDIGNDDYPMECDIPYLLEQTAIQISSIFSLEIEHSKEITNTYYNRLLKRLSLSEVAEMIWHDTPFEIALLSYYCVELKNIDSRDMEYLDWRRQYYQK